ncbi:MAG: ATP-binding cassette domain-containing protein [Patescibacteria group bacterium]|nr:ATP-binding cassette domain-containing protein [Patescibacteria group bacterium]
MIQLTNVSKVFGTGAAGLSDVSLTIHKGEFAFLVGHTGSGKTTLLRLLIREMLPTQGDIMVGGIDVVKLPPEHVSHYRRKIGIVFQDLRLLTERTVFENVLLPLEIAGVKTPEAKKRVEELLQQVGVLEHAEKFPVQLSGGELQRVAIARALTLGPEVILADEPTGNLDTATAFEIVGLLDAINKAGTTIVMATHNMDIVRKYPKNRLVKLSKGKLEGQKDQKPQEEKKETVQTHEKKDEMRETKVKTEEKKADEHKKGDK